MVFQVCLPIVSDPYLAEDLCQDVFITVKTKIASFRGRSKLKTWLYAIAKNAALAARRRPRPVRGDVFSDVPLGPPDFMDYIQHDLDYVLNAPMLVARQVEQAMRQVESLLDARVRTFTVGNPLLAGKMRGTFPGVHLTCSVNLKVDSCERARQAMCLAAFDTILLDNRRSSGNSRLTGRSSGTLVGCGLGFPSGVSFGLLP